MYVLIILKKTSLELSLLIISSKKGTNLFIEPKHWVIKAMSLSFSLS